MDTFDFFTQSLSEMNATIFSFLPRLALAAAVLIIGWLIAKLFRALIIKAFKLFRLDLAAEKAGVESFLSHGGVGFNSTNLVGAIAYWLTIFLVALTALNILGLQMVSELFSKTMLYIPNIIVAILVITFGSIIARLVQTVLAAYFHNIGFESANLLGKLTQYAILTFVVFVALEQLSIGGDILVSAFQISFGAVCLSAAIAFGLGGKELASKILNKTWEQMHRN